MTMTTHLPPELVNKTTWKIPNALCLIGSRAGGRWNGMTASWVTQVSMEPVLIAVAIDNKAVTKTLIDQGGSFTVNLWDRTDTRPFVKFSKPATFADMELNGRPVREGATGAPIFEEAVAWLECAVDEAHDVGTHTVYYGRLVGCGIRDDEAEVASMSDTRMKYGGVKRGGH